MIEIIADMHTHTVHSHGTGTVEDNVKAAISAGLQQIVISDHGPQHLFYNIKDVDAYLKDIDAMRKKYKNDIEVLAGVEFNLLSEDGDMDLPPQYADCLLYTSNRGLRYNMPSAALRAGCLHGQIPV